MVAKDERSIGQRARDRPADPMSSAPFHIRTIDNRDEDCSVRKLRGLVPDGHSLGDLLVSDTLARTWTGRREPWC